MPPPEVSPFNGPCNRAKCNPPPLVFAFTSPVRSWTSIPPPAVPNRVLNFAGTVIVYFASFEFRPVHDQLLLALSFELIVTVSPSSEKLTGLSFKNFSSADLLLRPTFRQTSTTTSLVAFVPTSIAPKSTSTTTVLFGFMPNFLLICFSVAALAVSDANGIRIDPQNTTNNAELISFSLFIVFLILPPNTQKATRKFHLICNRTKKFVAVRYPMFDLHCFRSLFPPFTPV